MVAPAPSESTVFDRQVDDMLARYIDWLEEAATSRDAYRRWSVAPPTEAHRRFATYLASLEQEEYAAVRYAAAVSRVAERF
jgi:hypothetical protein